MLYALCFIGLNSCKTEDIATEGPILINFINKSGETLRNVTVNDVRIGTIVRNGQTGLVSFERFTVDTGSPDCNFVAIFKNFTARRVPGWCGTQKSPLKPGIYNVEVSVSVSENEAHVGLRFQ